MVNLTDEAINISSDLIKINSVNPSFNGPGEWEKSRYVVNKLKEYCKKYNIKNYILKEYNIKDNNGIIRPNILFKIDFNCDRTLHIISHLDTVPPGDLSLWDNDPFTPVVKDGYIYGRGSEDNHKAIVSSFLLLKMLYGDEKENKEKKEKKVNFNLSLIFLSDEECGSVYGIQHLLKYRSEIFNKDDIIIVPDFGSEDGTYIEIAEKNILWLKFKVRGKQCHGSTPDNGVNADIIMFNFGNDLYNYLYSRYNLEDNIFTPPYSTFEPTICGNNVENTNTIPGYGELHFDCRILPHYNVDDILNDIDNFIKEYLSNFENKGYLIKYDKKELQNIQITYDILNLERSKKIDENSYSVVLLKRAIKEVIKKEPRVCGMGGGTIGAFLREKEYDTVVWGIGEETAHQPNEHIKINDLIKMAEVFYHILTNKLSR